MSLFPDEEITFSHLEEPSESLSDDQINDKYSKGLIRIVTEQARYPLNTITSLLESGDYDLNPEFQRRYRWNIEKKSRLIESFIMNVPIPPIFLYEDRYSHYEVMDGLQRLTTIKEFYKDEFVLENLEEWKELNGRKYSQLPEQIKRGIDRRHLSSIILLQETAKSKDEAERLKQIVFERINSGGVKLEPQESRNAIYNGPLNQLCITLARNKYLCRMWGIPEPTQEEVDKEIFSAELIQNKDYQKMNDVELVLRFFAYRQRLLHQKGSLREYLDNYLKYGNLFPKDVCENLEMLFNETVKLVYNIFGEKAFCQWRKRNGGWYWYQRPTTVIYDPLMYSFSQYLNDTDEIMNKKDEFQKGIMKLYEENYDSFEGRYTNLTDIAARNRLFIEFIASILGN